MRNMQWLNLRVRGALRQTFWFSVAAMIVAALTYGMLSLLLHNALDAELQRHSSVVRQQLVSANGAVATLQQLQVQPAKSNGHLSRHGVSYELVDSTGKLLDASGEQVPVSDLARSRAGAAAPEWETVEADGVRYRVLDEAIGVPPRGFLVLRTLLPLTETDEALARWGEALLLLLPLLIGVQAFTAWSSMRPLLHRIAKLEHTAEQVAAGRYAERFPTSEWNDELDSLSRALNAALAEMQADQKEMKDFVPNLMHELRRPLTVLRCEADLALASKGTSPACREILSNQVEHLHAVESILNDMSALSQAGSTASSSDENLSELMNAAVEGTVCSFNDHSLNIASAIEEGIWVKADAGQMWRLVLNLIDNAIKYNSPNGRIDIALASRDNMAVVSVSDTGAGIPDSELPKIFGRFYRCDSAKRSSVRGLGLGLSFVRRIAEAHGGEVRVSSEVGVGTTFEVSIPLAPLADARTSKSSAPSCAVATPVLQS